MLLDGTFSLAYAKQTVVQTIKNIDLHYNTKGYNISLIKVLEICKAFNCFSIFDTKGSLLYIINRTNIRGDP